VLDEHAFDAILCYLMVIEHDGKELGDPCVVMVYIVTPWYNLVWMTHA